MHLIDLSFFQFKTILPCWCWLFGTIIVLASQPFLKLFTNRGQFHKRFNTSVFLFVRKRHFFGNNYKQHVANLSILVPILAFKLPILTFLEPNLYNEIELWTLYYFLALGCKNFGVKAFMKLNNKRLKYFGFMKYKFWHFGFMKSTPGLHQ